MAYNNLFNYKAALSYQDKMVDIQGVVVTLFKPVALEKVGYEDVDNSGRFIPTKQKCMVDFNPGRKVYYHFNWFPDDMADLSVAFFRTEVEIGAEYFFRTATIEQVSPYGDLVFKVVRVFDEGKYSVLKRTCFVRAINDRQLFETLVVI